MGAICGECGSIRMKTVLSRRRDKSGYRIEVEAPITEDDPDWEEIVSVWCPNCGILSDSSV